MSKGESVPLNRTEQSRQVPNTLEAANAERLALHHEMVDAQGKGPSEDMLRLSAMYAGDDIRCNPYWEIDAQRSIDIVHFHQMLSVAFERALAETNLGATDLMYETERFLTHLDGQIPLDRMY